MSDAGEDETDKKNLRMFLDDARFVVPPWHVEWPPEMASTGTNDTHESHGSGGVDEASVTIGCRQQCVQSLLFPLHMQPFPPEPFGGPASGGLFSLFWVLGVPCRSGLYRLDQRLQLFRIPDDAYLCKNKVQQACGMFRVL